MRCSFPFCTLYTRQGSPLWTTFLCPLPSWLRLFLLMAALVPQPQGSLFRSCTLYFPGTSHCPSWYFLKLVTVPPLCDLHYVTMDECITLPGLDVSEHRDQTWFYSLLYPSVAQPVKNLPAVQGLGSIPGLERSLGEGKGYPLQYSGLENSMN